MKKNFKKPFLTGFTVFSSALFSHIFALGMAISYLFTLWFCNNFVDAGKINPMIFNIKNWQIHFHHWLLGGSLFALALNFSLSPIYLGLCGGIMLHDFYHDKDWHRVLKRM